MMPKVCCFSKTIEVQNDFWFLSWWTEEIVFCVTNIVEILFVFDSSSFCILPICLIVHIFIARRGLTNSCKRRCISISKPKKARSRLIFWEQSILFRRKSYCADTGGITIWKLTEVTPTQQPFFGINILQRGTFSTNVSKSERGTGCQEEIQQEIIFNEQWGFSTRKFPWFEPSQSRILSIKRRAGYQKKIWIIEKKFQLPARSL